MHDLGVIRDRLRQEILETPVDPADAQRLANELAADGTWPDIDYADHEGVQFQPAQHLTRLLSLARTGKHPEAARNALDGWRHRDPHSDNWWWNEIGAPRLLGDTLLLLADELDTRERGGWADWLAACAGPVERPGQNLIWIQSIVLRRGLLVDDGGLVASAVTRMSTVLRPTDGEGIQDDLSFHQHGAQLYSGGYGSSLTADVALWIYAVHGTPWAFGAPEVRLFTDFLLDGQQWAVHGGGYDFATMGREITRAEAHDATGTLRTVLRRLLECDPPRREELAAFDARLAGEGDGRAPAGPVGCRYYPRSDYLVHRRPSWSVSVRMSSTRTAPTESMNGENLRGRHLGDGVMTIRVGDEPHDGYRAAIPLWDWARLPGVTAEQLPDRAALLPRPNGRHGSSADVGGWSDGRYGIALMRLEGTDRIADGWKAWFCFDDLVVALGTGITAPSAEHPVVTTIDQRLAEGLLSAGPDPNQLRYVHHGRIGYVPLSDTESVFARVERRTGSWSDIAVTGATEPLSAEIFSIGFDHGPRPYGATYACMILPATDPATTAEASIAPGVTVLSNTPELQSVRCDRSGVTLVARHDSNDIALARES